MLIDVGRPCHCGWLHSLGRGFWTVWLTCIAPCSWLWVCCDQLFQVPLLLTFLAMDHNPELWAKYVLSALSCFYQDGLSQQQEMKLRHSPLRNSFIPLSFLVALQVWDVNGRVSVSSHSNVLSQSTDILARLIMKSVQRAPMPRLAWH